MEELKKIIEDYVKTELTEFGTRGAAYQIGVASTLFTAYGNNPLEMPRMRY